MKLRMGAVVSLCVVLCVTAIANLTAQAEDLKFLTAGFGPLRDGVYKGKDETPMGSLEVTVKIKDGRIADIKVPDETYPAEYAKEAMRIIPAKIIESQSLGVDAVTGATVTSDSIISAVRSAIKKAAISKKGL